MLFQFLNTFLGYLLELLPFFLVASAAGAGLQTYARGIFSRATVSKPYSPFITAFAGAIIPVCSCSMIPLAKTIDSFSQKNYAPVLAFLITAPVLSPITILLTFGMFGLELTVTRVLFTLIFSFFLAYSSGFIFQKRVSLPLLQEGRGYGRRSVNEFILNFKNLFINTGKYILLGLVIASLLKVLVPEGVMVKFSESELSYVLIALISVPIYVCSGEEVPIARSLHDLGLSEGKALTFMLASSGICVPTISALLSFLPKGLVAYYTLSWFLFSVSAGLMFDRF